MCFYGFDRLLRMIWTALPRRALVYRVKGDGIAQVRIAKNPITQSLGMHHTGQYFFLNFPHISLLEWHPYSVSSGPRERDVEFHIRDLGDHTHQICETAKSLEDSPSVLPYVRFDGPYGHHDFNFRAYPKVLLCGGGVGVTPVIGMLKDVYNVGNYDEVEASHVPPHIIKHLFAIWVVRYKADYDWFKQDLEHCMEAANRPEMPQLTVLVYVSRLKPEEKTPGLIAGRPNMPKIFDAVNAANKGVGPTLAFACGPGAMVNEIWDLTVERTTEKDNIDFHHETFEF
jgi:NAD(P)H-flavin reductase